MGGTACAPLCFERVVEFAPSFSFDESFAPSFSLTSSFSFPECFECLDGLSLCSLWCLLDASLESGLTCTETVSLVPELVGVVEVGLVSDWMEVTEVDG